jgi:DnaJ-class molecular chaperone
VSGDLTIGPDLIERYEDNEPFEYCKHCGQPMDWIECDQCGGEGFFDSERLTEEDPQWYDEDDTEDCSDCNGNGGWWHCFNAQCPGKQETGERA